MKNSKAKIIIFSTLIIIILLVIIILCKYQSTENKLKSPNIGTVESKRILDLSNSNEIQNLIVKNELQFISYIDNSGQVSRSLINRNGINIDNRIYNYIKSNNPNLSEYDVVAIKDCIIENSKEHNFDPLLIASTIKCESNFNEDTKSDMGACGIMQILPSTAQPIANNMGIYSYDLFNYKDNIEIGSECLDIYINSWQNITQIDYRTGDYMNKSQMGLLSYNGGVGTARTLKNIDYLHNIESQYYKLRYTNLYD